MGGFLAKFMPAEPMRDADRHELHHWFGIPHTAYRFLRLLLEDCDPGERVRRGRAITLSSVRSPSGSAISPRCYELLFVGALIYMTFMAQASAEGTMTIWARCKRTIRSQA